MCAVSSENGPSKEESRNGARAGGRLAQLRKSRLRALAMEPLESRALMAVLPPLSTNPSLNTMVQGGETGNQVNPSVVIDPLNPQKMVAVWTRDDPGHALSSANGVSLTAWTEGAYSTDGGRTWSTLGGGVSSDGIVSDFTATSNPPLLPQATDASVAFDANGNFYIAQDVHKADYSVGELITERYSFAGASPMQTLGGGGMGNNANVVARWSTVYGAIYKPIIAADGNVTTANGQTDPATSFNSPITGQGPFGAVYITATTSQQPFVQNVGPSQNSRTVLMTSVDGGLVFSSTTLSTVGGDNGGTEEASSPTIAISQGNTSGTVPAGQATVVWTDSGTSGNNDYIRSNTINWSAQPTVTAFAGGPIMSPPAPTLQSLTITPVVNNYNITVSGAPANFSLVNLTAAVNLAVTDPTAWDLGGISIQLIAPDGVHSATLLRNTGTQTAANNNNAVVITTTSVSPSQGVAVTGNSALNATFADDAALSIKGTNAQGTQYQIDGSTVNNDLATAFGGLTQVNGNWTLRVTSYLNSATGSVNNVSLSMLGTVLGGEKQVVQLYNGGGVHGATNAGTFSEGSAAVPNRGISPAPALASDNTFGPNSPHEGRLYLAYVDRQNSGSNPSYNTNVYLLTSDDGGKTWQNPATGTTAATTANARLVNDDNPTTDGYSEGDRPQFMPSVAVDPATGTLGISFFDARDDPSVARVANYVGLSNDGGASFSPETYVNIPEQAYNPINDTTVTLGPVPDNQSAAGGIADTTFNFGDHQALLMYDGQVLPVWASNQNGGVNISGGTSSTNQLLSITMAHATTAAGPRVATTSEGTVGTTYGPRSDALNPNPNADSGPSLSTFSVTFDRAIDAGSFHPNNVTLTYEDPNGNKTVYDSTNLGFTISPSSGFASTFTVTTGRPLTAPGTYTIRIAPNAANGTNDIRTDVQYYNAGNLVSYEYMDQAANNPANAGKPSNAFTTYNASDLTSLPLLIPGPHVVSTSVPGSTNADGLNDNLVLNPSAPVTTINVTFDRDMKASTIVDPASPPANYSNPNVIRVMGPAGPISGPFHITQVSATTYAVSFPGQVLNGTYTITLASSIADTNGNALDTNLNAGLYQLRGTNPYGTVTIKTYNATIPVAAIPNPVATVPNTNVSTVNVPDSFLVKSVSVKLNITYPYDPDLTAYLLAPGAVINPDGSITGLSARLFSNNGSSGSAANYQDTTFIDSGNPGVTPISVGGAPFFNGTFAALDPFTPFTAANGGSGIQANGTWQLYIVDALTHANSGGTINSWSLSLGDNVATNNTGLGEAVADQATVSFRILTDGPSNPQSSNTWTSAGPAAIGTFSTGRVGGLAVDPSDPSGNTVYVGGASGGIWKTTNFLTSSANGPTWIPLTDFGPTADNNIGGIAIFGVNNDPNQSMIFAATGEGDTGSRGKGFLRSTDGGASWVWLDSTNNNLPYAQRDHLFASKGTSAFKVVVDPRLNASGGVTVYAALSGNALTQNAGLWRSQDSGQTWQLMRAGNCTDVTLDPLSGTGAVNGNLQVVYAAFGGDGVYMSPNQGQSWFQMLGTAGNPLIQQNDKLPNTPDPVVNKAGNVPSGATATRIQLAKPVVLNSPNLNNPSAEDLQYEGWLYALVSNGDAYNGLYLTKDNGQNWTRIDVSNAPGVGLGTQVPTNNASLSDVDVLGGQGSYNLSLAIDPTNPNVVYIGGSSNADMSGKGTSGFIRVDATNILDAHNETPFDAQQNDGGLIQKATTGGITENDTTKPITPLTGSGLPYINLLRNPSNFFANATTFTTNIKQFNNVGVGATWIPFSGATAGSTDQHRLVTIVDPTTGHARLIIGDDQGVYTGVDNGGSYVSNLGSQYVAFGSRVGNLTLTQYYYGAVQPSAHVSGTNATRPVTFYGGAQDTGDQTSQDILGSGNLRWGTGGGDAMGVATDPTGSGTVYRFIAPADAGTDFFEVNGVGRTNGLVNLPAGQSVDPQWGYAPIGEPDNTVVGNFTVNPVNGNQILISGSTGIVYRTEDQGLNWFVVGDASSLDGRYADALAFGAPDPNSPNGIGNLDNFLYAGTVGGNIYVSTTGGGSAGGGNAWTQIDNGLAGAGVIHQIIPDPTRGSHAAFAVAQNGVYYIADSVKSASNPNPTWVNITGNLHQLLTPAIGDTMGTSGDGSTATQTQQLADLTSLQVDWRYLIANSTGDPIGQGTHPVLYVGGDSGVYRSTDDGLTWAAFPSTDPQLDNAPVQGGYLPHVRVTSMQLSDGNINPQTGRATISTASGVTDPSLLEASTYGRGSFFIQLAPIVIPNATSTQPTNLYIDATSLGGTTTSGVQYTNSATNGGNVTFDGTSEQSAFGNVVTLKAYDETKTLPNGSANPNYGKPIPGATATTDANGHFTLTVPGYFTSVGTFTVGIQATDQSGTVGNMATLDFVVNGPPPAPSNIVLDSSTDSGTSNTDGYTDFNNSSTHPAPVLDVFGIQAPITSTPTTVVLLRAAVTNGVVGPYSVVNTVTTPAGFTGGELQIADINGGNGAIPDITGNTPATAPPPQPNEYVYEAYQINSFGTLGPVYAQDPTKTGVIIDTSTPKNPTGITLDASTDSGPSSTDGYTNFNNATPPTAPVFDISGIEPGATVVLLRNGVEVNRITNASPQGANSTVQVADTNSGSGTIADSPLGSPIDTLSSANPYQYSAYQISLSGIVSGVGKPVFGNAGAIVIDGTDSDNHGDNAGPGGTNENGWLYMQKVLAAIQPNVTNGQKVLVAVGSDPSLSTSGGFFGASGNAAAINSAFLQSPLPKLGWSIAFITDTSGSGANVQNFLNGQTVPAETFAKTAIAGGINISQAGMLYLPTFMHASGGLTTAELTALDASGPQIKTYVNNGGGLFAQSETPITGGFGGGGGNFPPSFGWLTTLFPGIQVVSSFSSPTPQYPIALTPAGQSTFPGLTNADLSAGPWHNYFTGNFGALVTAATGTVDDTTTDPAYGMAEPLILTTTGSVTGGSTSALGVIIDATPPVTPSLSLDPVSITGQLTTPPQTQDNNSVAYPAPTFDVTNVEPNATVNLYRVALDASGLPIGSPVLVNSITEAANSTPQTAQISDSNGGNGLIPNGAYQYFVTQTDLAGNVSALTGGGLTIGSPGTAEVIVTTGLPPAPTKLKLDPSTDTGSSTTDGVTRDNNGNPYPTPLFDVSGLVVGDTLELFRSSVVNGVPSSPVQVNSATITATSMMIADTNNQAGKITDGTYFYTARQVDPANNVSPASVGQSVTISAAPPATPPAPVLDASTDTGTFSNDGVTQDNNGKFPAPLFDIGSTANPVPAGATVTLFRATVTNGVAGQAKQVNQLINTGGGAITIADTNGGGGQILDGKYLYTVQITSLSGVTSSFSTGTPVTIQATSPALPTPLVLDPASDTGVSSSDSITQITLKSHPVFDAGPAAGKTGTPVAVGATVDLWRAPLVGGVTGQATLVSSLTNTAGGQVKITDPGVIPDGQYVYTVQQIDLAGNSSVIGSPLTVTYATLQPAAPSSLVLDPSNPGNPASNQTSSSSPVFDIKVSLPGFEANSAISLVRDGAVVNLPLTYNATTGTIKVTDPNAPAGPHVYQAFVTDLAGNSSTLTSGLTVTISPNPPGTLTLVSTTGAPGSNITSVTSPIFTVAGTAPNSTLELLRDGTPIPGVAVSTGAGGTVTIQDPGPLVSRQYTYTTVQFNSSGVPSTTGPALMVTVDTSTPATPYLVGLDQAADSGAKGDGITNSQAPGFDVTGLAPGSTLVLLRNGQAVPSTQSSQAGGVAVVTDATVANNGKILDGTYTYTVEQVNNAGTPSSASNGLNIQILTTPPAAPTVVLDANSQASGGPSNVANSTQPTFDVSGIVPGDTVELLKLNSPTSNPNDPNSYSLVKMVVSAPSSTLMIQDFGPLTAGQGYTYKAVQIDQAGNSSADSTLYGISVSNASSTSTPTVPTLTLVAASDSGLKGDGITSVRQPSFTGKTDPNTAIYLYADAAATNRVGTAMSDSTGAFMIQPGSPLAGGVYSFVAKASKVAGSYSAASTPVPLKLATTAGDFQGVYGTQEALTRQTTANQLQWFVLHDGSVNGRVFGASSTDEPVQGDFTGAGTQSLATYTPSTGVWSYASLANNYATTTTKPFGTPNVDVPAAADYMGLGYTQIAVYEPTKAYFVINNPTAPNAPDIVLSNLASYFYTNKISPAQYSKFIPVPGDYDNLGKDEPALYDPAMQNWYIFNTNTGKVTKVGFGGNNDIPVPGAYFATATNHAVTEAVWRPSTSSFLIRTPNGGTDFVPFAKGDIPAPGDYAGSGVTVPAVYRPSAANFFVSTVNGGTPRPNTSFAFGGSNFVPVNAPYAYHALKSVGGTISAFSVNLGSTAATFSAAPTVTTSSNTAAPSKAASSSKATTPPPVAVVQGLARPAQAATPAVDTVLTTMSLSAKRRLLGL